MGLTIIDKIKWRLRPEYIVNKFSFIFNRFGYTLAPKGLGYINPDDVVPKARLENKTLCEYLESNNIGAVGKRRDFIIETLKDAGVFEHKTNILEIGAGTGMYLEKTIELAEPETYEVYETSPAWVKYLRDEYSRNTKLICHNADGQSLKQTADAGADLILVHAVFVYLPLLVTMRYLMECVRCIKPGGLIVFDIFSGKHFDLQVVNQWLVSEPRYTFPVITSEDLIEQFAVAEGLQLVRQFNCPYHGTVSTYFIVRK